MPIQGTDTTPGPQEVVPNPDKVKEIGALLSETKLDEKDKRFIKNDTSPVVAGDGLEILNACLSAITVLSFLGGPQGIVVAAGIVLFQGLLAPAAKSATPDPLKIMYEKLKKLHDDDKVKNQLIKVRAVANSIENQWRTTIDSLEPATYDEKIRIDGDLRFQTGAEPGSLSVSVLKMEDLMTWDESNVRISILASLTYLFVVWNLQCRLYASLAHIKAQEADTKAQEASKEAQEASKKAQEASKEAQKASNEARKKYESHVSTFRARVLDAKKELATRSDNVKELYTKLKNDRIAEAEWIGVENHAPMPIPGVDNPNVIYTVAYKDKHTGKEYNDIIPNHWFWPWPAEGTIAEKEKEKKSEFEAYKNDLTEHVNRVLANDLVIVDKWAGIVTEAEQLLRPPAPKLAPTVHSYRPTEKAKVHAYLINAHSVTYAFAVGTAEDGDSQPSPWTDWIELKVDEKGMVLLPVLVLHDGNYPAQTRRTVWHRQSLEKPASDRPDPTDKMLDDWKTETVTAAGSVLWCEP